MGPATPGATDHRAITVTSPNLCTTQIVVALAIAIAMTACGRDDDRKPSSQVAAKVNKEEITVHQLNNAMTQFRNVGEDQQKTVTRQVLERMIDQELLVQKAVEKKLDRDPRIVQAIEASKRQILSQAYLDHLGANTPRPGAEEVRKFFEERPELFAERKIYRLQELSIPARPEITTKELESEIRKAKSLNDVVAWLKSKNVPFNANSTVKAPEQLPLEVVPRLAQLQIGQVMLVPAQQGYLLVQVAATEKQPLDAKQAAPFIEQYLVNQRKLELARAEVKQLRDTAKIEYVGIFAENAAAKPVADSKPPSAPPVDATKSAMDRGIGGLR